jgi:hypothetical protein
VVFYERNLEKLGNKMIWELSGIDMMYGIHTKALV